jgi:5'-deoxynucleotidase YfbR-like HD superfamily hydrolase
MTDPWAIFDAGQVRRWHCNAAFRHVTDTTAEHSARVARLVLAMWPFASRELLIACLQHDDGESGAWGDISGPAKARMSAAARCELEQAEEAAIIDLWGHKTRLCDRDAKMLRLADRLDAFMFARTHAPHILDRDGWPEARAWLEAAGIELGVSQFVRRVIR